MTTTAGLPPIPGTLIDPLPKATPDVLVDIDEADSAASAAVGVGYRAMTRFNEARATLLAAGTTYYVFLALFSLIALAYGVTALLGADRVASYLTIAISEAFPGLLGEDGIDPASLRAVGQTASVIGLLTMLYAGSGAMVSTNSSIHVIYGAPKDPRNYVMKRVRLLGWLLAIAPLIAFSFVAVIFTDQFGGRVLSAIGLEPDGHAFLSVVVSVVLTLGADFLVVYLILGKLGGIRPPRRAHLIGGVVGALGIAVVRIPMGLILEFSIDKPQYGALTIPIGVLLVLYLNSVIVYGAAAFCAGIAEKDVPLEEIAPGVDLDETLVDLPEE
ncbi:MAG: YihY/virulence factor BrkB family protein [Actinomycetota bacterium]